MGVVINKKILDELADMYPEFTRRSLKGLVNYGNRRLIHYLNMGDNVFINGNTKSRYDGVLFCEDVSYVKHIEKEKNNKLKRLNRERVRRFKNKNRGKD